MQSNPISLFAPLIISLRISFIIEFVLLIEVILFAIGERKYFFFLFSKLYKFLLCFRIKLFCFYQVSTWETLS